MVLRPMVFIILFVVCGDALGQCIFNNFVISNSVCDQSGRILFTLNLSATGNSSKFSVIGNGKNYGTFSYSALPLSIGPFNADCSTEYEFLIRDSINISCQTYKKVGKLCCEDLCKIRVSRLTADMCKEGKYELGLDLKYFAPPDGFDVFHNGKLLNTFQYSSLPLKVKEVNSSLHESFNTISVCAFNDKTCCDTVLLTNPCICSIANVRGQILGCSLVDKKFNVKVNFDHQGVSDSFRIGGNLINYGTFAYKDLPITIKNLTLSESIDYEFLIIDKSNPICFNSFSPGIVSGCNFTCKLNIHSIQQMFCDSIKITLSLKVKDDFAGVNGFILYHNTQKIGQYKYGQKEYLID